MAVFTRPVLLTLGLCLVFTFPSLTTSSNIVEKSYRENTHQFLEDSVYNEAVRRRRSVRRTGESKFDDNPCRPDEQFDSETYQCIDVDVESEERLPRLPFNGKYFTEDFQQCAKLELDKSMYIVRPEGYIDVPIFNRIYRKSEFGMMNNSDKAYVCYPHEYQECMRWILFPGEFTILPNKSLYSNQHHEIHEFGYYKVLRDTGRAIVCYRGEFGITGENAAFHNVLFSGWILSQICLLLTFALQVNCKVKMSSFRKSLLCYTCSMFTAYLSLSLAEVAMPMFPQSINVCMMVFIQLSFLATFSWLNVLCFDICRDFRMLMTGHSSDQTRATNSSGQPSHWKFTLYSVHGWSWPIFLAIVTLIIDFSTYHDSPMKPAFVDGMWFSGPYSGILLFYGPMGTSLMCNLILFCYTLYVIMKVTSGTSSQVEQARTRWLSAIKLFLVMGISWIFEVMSWATHTHSPVWYITDFINSIHGVFVFLIFNWAWLKSTALYFRKRWSWSEDTQQLDEAIDGVVQERPLPDIQMVQKATAVSALAEDLAKPKRYTELKADPENPDEE